MNPIFLVDLHTSSCFPLRWGCRHWACCVINLQASLAMTRIRTWVVETSGSFRIHVISLREHGHTDKQNVSVLQRGRHSICWYCSIFSETNGFEKTSIHLRHQIEQFSDVHLQKKSLRWIKFVCLISNTETWFINSVRTAFTYFVHNIYLLLWL